jgi:16S rRNA (adenine1518-N6/adenine1519-N6)-dimethyltransferase
VRYEKLLFRTIRASFAQRRKKLLNGLSSAFSGELTKDQLREVIAACGFPETVRGETLGIPEFERVAEEVGRRLGQNG